MKRLIVLSTMMFIMTAGNSCKETPAETGNPLLAEWDTPMGVPPFDRISPEHYSEAFEETMRMHNEQIEAITASDEQPTFDNTILALDRAGRELSEISLIFTMVAAADTNEQIQRIEAEIMPELSAHYNDILLNDALFARIEDVYSRRATLGLDKLQMRLLEKTRRDFVRAGALLDTADKARLKEIDSELAALSIRFGNNLLAETRDFKLLLDEEQVADLPEGVKSAAAEQAKQAGESGYMFTLDKPSMLPFLTYSPQRELREQLYKGYLSRCERGNERDNKQLIKDMTRLRAAARREGPPAGLSLLRRLCHGRRDGRHARGRICAARPDLDAGARTRPRRNGGDDRAAARGSARSDSRIMGLVVLCREAPQEELPSGRGAGKPISVGG